MLSAALLKLRESNNNEMFHEPDSLTITGTSNSMNRSARCLSVWNRQSSM